MDCIKWLENQNRLTSYLLGHLYVCLSEILVYFSPKGGASNSGGGEDQVSDSIMKKDHRRE